MQLELTSEQSVDDARLREAHAANAIGSGFHPKKLP